MLTTALIVTIVTTFVAGYYLGHQMGSTAHIRTHLAEVRQRRQ